MVSSFDITTLRAVYATDLERVRPYLPQRKMMTDFEREALACLALDHNTGLGMFEFGTWHGFTTYYLGKVLPDVEIVTVDIDASCSDSNNIPAQQGCELLTTGEIGLEFKNCGMNIRQIIANSSTLNIAEYGQRDLVLVDGNHSFEYVKQDSENGMKMLRSGGVLVLHDYDAVALEDGSWNDPNLSSYGVILYVQGSPELNWSHIPGTCLAFAVKE